MKKILYFNLLLLFLIALVGCGSENNPTTEIPTDGQTEEQKTPVEKTPVEEVDYGKVTFNNVKVFSDEFDGVSLKYTFTNPDVCVNEVFEFEISNEKICYIEDGKVYFLSEGMTRVKAVSQNLTAYFNVVCQNYRFTSQSKTQLNKLKNNFKDGDTLFLGDSFFEFWRNKTGIAENFDTAFSQYAVCNIGISATTTHHWRAINVKMAELDIKPKNIVINIGINNVDDDKESGKESAANVINLIEDYLQMFPEANIYYLSITRCAGHFAFNWESHEKSNQLVQDFCSKTERVYYLDIMGLYGDDYGSYQQDGLHPNQAGYDLFKQLIMAEVPMNKKN